MKQAIIHGDLTVTYELGAEVPQAAPNEVIIRAVTAGLNPIDWKGAKQVDADALHRELRSGLHRASGKDFAGYVHSVGKCARHCAGLGRMLPPTRPDVHLPNQNNINPRVLC